jgi:hypothetical protein
MVIASTLFYRRRVLFDDNDAAQGGRIIKWGARARWHHLLGAVSRTRGANLYYGTLISSRGLDLKRTPAHTQHQADREMVSCFCFMRESAVCNTFDVEEWSMTSASALLRAFAYQSKMMLLKFGFNYAEE